MTIAQFIELVLRHNVNLNKDLYVCTDEEACGDDFFIDEDDMGLYLVVGEWGGTIHHYFKDEQNHNIYSDSELHMEEVDTVALNNIDGN